MPPGLTPELALAYLRALSTDLREGVVLSAGGDRLAGPAALAHPARGLLAAAPDTAELAVGVAGGRVFAARSASHALVLACGPHALDGLVAFDLRAVLADLGGADDAPVAVPMPARPGPSANAGPEALRPLAAAVLAAAGGPPGAV